MHPMARPMPVVQRTAPFASGRLIHRFGFWYGMEPKTAMVSTTRVMTKLLMMEASPTRQKPKLSFKVTTTTRPMQRLL